MISVPDRLLCISLIREAEAAGCRLHCACAELDICIRTYQRWVRDGDDAVGADRRTTSVRPTPGNKLSAEERTQILAVANSEEFASLPPSQIVPALTDQGVYLASESSFYRVLKEAQQQHHRGVRRSLPSGSLRNGTEPGVELGHHVATGGNQGHVLLLVHDSGCVQSQDRRA